MKSERNKELLSTFITGKINPISILPALCELFNPNNEQVSDEFLTALVNDGGKSIGSDLKDNEFLVCEGKRRLVIDENVLPPSGTLDGEKWCGIKDLKKLMRLL